VNMVIIKFSKWIQTFHSLRTKLFLLPTIKLPIQVKLNRKPMENGFHKAIVNVSHHNTYWIIYLVSM
jgi:hypothetical protein